MSKQQIEKQKLFKTQIGSILVIKITQNYKLNQQMKAIYNIFAKYFLILKILFIKNYVKNIGYLNCFNMILDNPDIINIRNLYQLTLVLQEILQYKLFTTQQISQMQLNFIKDMLDKYTDIYIYSRYNQVNQSILSNINQTVIHCLLNNYYVELPDSSYYNINDQKTGNIIFLQLYYKMKNQISETHQFTFQRLFTLFPQQGTETFFISFLLSLQHFNEVKRSENNTKTQNLQNTQQNTNQPITPLTQLTPLTKYIPTSTTSYPKQLNFFKFLQFSLLFLQKIQQKMEFLKFLSEILQINFSLKEILKCYQITFFKFLNKFPQNEVLQLSPQIFSLPIEIEQVLKPNEILCDVLLFIEQTYENNNTQEPQIEIQQSFIEQLQFYMLNGQFDKIMLSKLLIQVLKVIKIIGDQNNVLKVLNRDKIQQLEWSDDQMFILDDILRLLDDIQQSK